MKKNFTNKAIALPLISAFVFAGALSAEAKTDTEVQRINKEADALYMKELPAKPHAEITEELEQLYTPKELKEGRTETPSKEVRLVEADRRLQENSLYDESSNQLAAARYFAAFDFGTSSDLGIGERVGVLNSWSSASNMTLPQNKQDWKDVLKIASGRWPEERNTALETKALETFGNIYQRPADRTNANDDAAVMIMAYGLRIGERNSEAELQAQTIYNGIYDKNPETAAEWDALRAIAYSGSTRVEGMQVSGWSGLLPSGYTVEGVQTYGNGDTDTYNNLHAVSSLNATYGNGLLVQVYNAAVPQSGPIGETILKKEKKVEKDGNTYTVSMLVAQVDGNDRYSSLVTVSNDETGVLEDWSQTANDYMLLRVTGESDQKDDVISATQHVYDAVQ